MQKGCLNQKQGMGNHQTTVQKRLLTRWLKICNEDEIGRMEPGWVERVYLGDQKYGRILQKIALGPKNSKQGQTALFFPILKIDGTSGARMFY